MEKRQIRACEMLSNNGDIRKVDENSYLVRSQRILRYYEVKSEDGKNWTCECPDFANRRMDCKHIYAVKLSSK